MTLLLLVMLCVCDVAAVGYALCDVAAVGCTLCDIAAVGYV